MVHTKVIVVVSTNPERWKAGAVDIQGFIFKPSGGKEGSLHFCSERDPPRPALLFNHVTDHLHVFNERSDLVAHHKQKKIVFIFLRQIGEPLAPRKKSNQ